MADGSLSDVLKSLHENVRNRLSQSSQSFSSANSKGSASESVWLGLFQEYLPGRYRSEKAKVVDSKGKFSDDIDVVIFDRQYTPLIFHFEGDIIVPAESVYAVFEAKQSISKNNIGYAHKKVQSVRNLHRTSLRIPHAGGEYLPKKPHHITGGVLSFRSDWSPALGDRLKAALNVQNEDGRLDIGCVAESGWFLFENGEHQLQESEKAATFFIFEFISQLQAKATVPMIDIRAYAEWIDQ